MNRETFMEVMSTAMRYYNKDLDPEVLKIYYDELGGMARNELEEKIRDHIRKMRSFPQIAHLKVWQEKVHQPLHSDHPEWSRHWAAGEAMLRTKMNGVATKIEGNFLFPLAPLVEEAFKNGQHMDRIYVNEADNDRAVESAMYGRLNVLLAQKFGGIKRD